jgi:hypothetical protein
MRFLIVLFFSFCFFQVDAQTIDTLNKSLNIGNAKLLSQCFANTIDLSLLDEEGIYSRTQSQLILDKFFSKNEPINYTVKHKGGKGNQSKFEIGLLKTKTKSFRTHLLYYELENSIQIIELRFELED